jgi:regulator of sigma E protease
MSIFITIILTVVFLSILIIGHELGHFAAAKSLGVKIKEFGVGYPPRLAGKRYRGTLYSFNAIPFGGFVSIEGLDIDKNSEQPPENDFRRQSFARKSLILLAGVFMNFLMAWFALFVVYSFGVPQSIYITTVFSGSAAEVVGIKNGDKISGFTSGNDFIKYIDEHAGKEIELSIERDNQIIPAKISVPEEKNKNGRLGLELVETGIPKVGLRQGLVLGFSKSWEMLGSIASSFGYLLRHGNFGDLSGPVGIWNAVRIGDKLGFGYLLQLFGFISLNLVFINILPLPALDGGRFLFLAIGKIMRRPVDYRTEAAVHSFFFAILLFLMIIVTIKDVSRLF